MGQITHTQKVGHSQVEMLFAHLKRILGLGRLRLRGPCGANDEFLLAATAQNLRKLAKIFPAATTLYESDVIQLRRDISQAATSITILLRDRIKRIALDVRLGK